MEEGRKARWAEAFVLIATATLVLFPILGYILNPAGGDVVWNGAIGPVVPDAHQYLAWIRDSSEHWTVGNFFGLDPIERRFLHPGIVATGLLVRAGLPASTAYLVASLVGVLVLCAAARSYVHSTVPEGWGRPAALAAGLLFVVPARQIVDLAVPEGSGWTFFKVALNDPTTVMRGYPYAALSLGLVLLSLTLFIRKREAGGRWWAVIAGCVVLATWLQPWQGIAVTATLVALEGLLATRRFETLATPHRGFWGKAGLSLMSVAACLAPLVYLLWLHGSDPAFSAMSLNGSVLRGSQHWWLLLAYAAILLPALTVFLIPMVSLSDLVIRIWPSILLATAMLLDLTKAAPSPDHTLRSLPIALSVPAVLGIRNLLGGLPAPGRIAGWSIWFGLIVIAGLAPREIALVQDAFSPERGSAKSHYMTRDDRTALRWLASSNAPAGGVIATQDIATAVPWLTGRQVWSGQDSWTPKSKSRRQATDLLTLGLPVPCCAWPFGVMSPLRFAAATGARQFVIGCGSKSPLTSGLESGAKWVRRFGCATVIGLNPPDPADRTAVESIYGRDREPAD